MSSDRIKHDIAWATALAYLDHILARERLTPEEAVRVFYRGGMDMLTRFEEATAREQARLRGHVAPSDN